jgi:tetratricopeptide (TPR) repeat protein
MIEKAIFTSRIAKPTVYSLHEKLDIQNAKSRYPYCSLLQMLDLLSDKAANIYQWNERFTHRVALHMPDVARLSTYLEAVKTIDISTPDDLKLKQQIEDAKNTEFAPADPNHFDVLDEINAYQEVSFKTAPKSVILEKYLEESNVDTSGMPEETPEKVVELGKKSIKVDDSIETETLAIILEKQKKYDKAISVYEKLITKIPEKSSTFAAQIERLKKEIENNKK